jgi:hypothetical protein
LQVIPDDDEEMAPSEAVDGVDAANADASNTTAAPITAVDGVADAKEEEEAVSCFFFCPF